MSEPLVTPRPIRRYATFFLIGLAIVLAACGGDGGGGGGGGGGGAEAKIHVLVVNAKDADVKVTYTDANGSPSEQTAATCTAQVYDFPVSDPFTVAIDGSTVIDSAQLANGMPGNGSQDLVVRVDVAKDGTTKYDDVRVGRNISVPARTAYCATLPGAG